MNINDWYFFHGVGNVIIFHRVVGPQVMGLHPMKAAIKRRCQRHALYSPNWRGSWASSNISPATTLSLAESGRACDVVLHRDAGMGGTRRSACQSRCLAGTYGSAPSMQATTLERVSALAKGA